MVHALTLLAIMLVAACITFIYRISSLSRPEQVSATDHPLLAGQVGQVNAYRLYDAIFFGAVKLIEHMKNRLPTCALMLDLKTVRLVLCGLKFQSLDMLTRYGMVNMMSPVNVYNILPEAMAST